MQIRTDCSETVPGCNLGRMYWQTNDIWQGASWAAIDYTGRYKMVQVGYIYTCRALQLQAGELWCRLST